MKKTIEGTGRVNRAFSDQIYFSNQIKSFINGITFKLTEVEPGNYQWIYTNPKDMPPNDLDDEILTRVVKEMANEIAERVMSHSKGL